MKPVCLKLEGDDPQRQNSGFSGSKMQLEFGEEIVHRSRDWTGGLVTHLKCVQLTV